MPDTTITIALPYQAQYMDIIFNELMPYVSDGNSKFIELYNNSNFYIDLNQFMLSNRDENQNLKNSKTQKLKNSKSQNLKISELQKVLSF